MKARKYTKRIQFYQTTNVADTYGGFTVSEALVATSWCNIKTVSNGQRLTDLGISDPSNSIILQLRQRNDIDYSALDMYVKYRGVKYIIQNAPTNTDFNDTEIEIVATREKS